MRRSKALVVASGILTLACTACPNRETNCQLVERGFGQAGSVPVVVESIVSGLEVPWGLAFLPDGDMLVTERAGRIRRLHEQNARTIATVPVSQSAESGLLGVVVHPQFTENRLFFLYYTHDTPNGPRNRVERWQLSEDGASASPDRVLLDDIPASPRHDGGRMRIGPDGMLYVGTGDANEPERSQDPASLAGKLLRLTLDGAIPADNPWPGSPAYLLGIRNTQGFDWFDARTLMVTDHGPSGELGRRGHDEVSVVTGPANLGWPKIYGCERANGMVTPALVWKDAVPPGGAVVYDADAIPEWRGSLLFTALGARHLHRVMFDPDNPKRVVAHEIYFEGEPPQGYGRLREIVVGPEGAVYVTTSNCDGRGSCPADKDRILRIVRRT